MSLKRKRNPDESLVLLLRYLFNTEYYYQSRLNNLLDQFSVHGFHSDFDYMRLYRAETELAIFNKLFSDIIKVIFDF